MGKKASWDYDADTHIATVTHPDGTECDFDMKKIVDPAICDYIKYYGWKQKATDGTARKVGETLTTGQIREHHRVTFARLTCDEPTWNAKAQPRKDRKETQFASIDRAVESGKITSERGEQMKQDYILVNEA